MKVARSPCEFCPVVYWSTSTDAWVEPTTAADAAWTSAATCAVFARKFTSTVVLPRRKKVIGWSDAGS